MEERQQHTFTNFIRDFIEVENLSTDQQRFFRSCFTRHVPFYVLGLWQGFPEWEVTKRALNELGVQLLVSNNAEGRRYCQFSLKGKVKAEAYLL